MIQRNTEDSCLSSGLCSRDRPLFTVTNLYGLKWTLPYRGSNARLARKSFSGYSLRIWATYPPRETGCDPAPPAQLCWSSSSSFPYICKATSWNWTV